MEALKFTVDQHPLLNATSYDAEGDPESVGPYTWHVDPSDFAHFIHDNGDGIGWDPVTDGPARLHFDRVGSGNLSVKDGAGNVDSGPISATAGKPVSVKITVGA